MSNGIDLAKRLQEVLIDGTWIANTNFKQQIDDTSWTQATYKFENLNTIAQLTFHINYYLAGINNVFDRGRLEIHDRYSFDMPPITNDQNWNILKKKFDRDAKQLINYIESISSAKLGEHFVESKYGNYARNIEGVIEHSYYHLGQISLIKKLIINNKIV